MAIIFFSSSTPSSNLPNYGIWDTLFKKGGHITGYALLAVCYWYAFNFEPGKTWFVVLMALIYAAGDEFHQSFTPGRHPSPVDVLVFDGGGAALGVLAAGFLLSWKKRIFTVSK